MCIGCHWANFRNFNASHPAGGGSGSTRRGALRGTAAAMVCAATAASPVFTAAAAIAAQTESDADLVFRNGPVYTIDSRNPWAKAVAVKGKRIVYVGDEAGVQSFVGPKTRIVDLAGKMLLPGFVEGHIHPLVGAAITQGVDLQFDTAAETLKALRDHRATSGTQRVVRGFGWRYPAFPPTGPRKEDLDAIWPDVPVILMAIDGHCAWVNSQALALAGVSRETKDPLPGFSYFERDRTTGEPTGYLVEVPAMLFVNNAIEPFSQEFITQGLLGWLPKASAAGITTVFDAGMPVLPEAEGFGIYLQLEQQGKLPLRVIGSYYHNRPDVDPLPIIKALRARIRSELVRASVLKLNMDGGDAQRTAAMLSPYADAPETVGDTMLAPDMLADIVRRADLEGIDIHIHSYGDRATRLSLDAFEAAAAANPRRDRRNALAHLILVDPADIPRFAKLGVIAQFSAQWAAPDANWRDISRVRLGTVRSSQFYCMGTLHRQGAVLSFGTDWPAAGHLSSYRPLDAIETAMTRRELGKADEPQLPPVGETVPLDVALRAATLGPAYQLGLEQDIGSVAVGKLADLVVLEKNLFEIAPADIHRTKVVMTVMNGRVLHEQAG